MHELLGFLPDAQSLIPVRLRSVNHEFVDNGNDHEVCDDNNYSSEHSRYRTRHLFGSNHHRIVNKLYAYFPTYDVPELTENSVVRLRCTNSPLRRGVKGHDLFRRHTCVFE